MCSELVWTRWRMEVKDEPWIPKGGHFREMSCLAHIFGKR